MESMDAMKIVQRKEKEIFFSSLTIDKRKESLYHYEWFHFCRDSSVGRAVD
jgi:hypothetical protein